MKFDQTQAFSLLNDHLGRMQSVHMRDLFKEDSNRVSKFSVKAAEIFLDFSKNRITEETLDLLVKLAEEQGLQTQIKAMMRGDAINNTENRAVLHTALRDFSDKAVIVEGQDVKKEIQNTRDSIHRFLNEIHEGKLLGYSGKAIKHLVSIGIGGSFLGPKMVVEALKPFQLEGFTCDFVANVDGSDIAETLKTIDPETTLFLIQSKTFTTQETLCNANSAKTWFLNQVDTQESDIAKHFCAVSTNEQGATDFGISKERIFPMWDWVGGRYSLWSAIGLPIGFVLGWEGFAQVLKGAEAMDIHFAEANFNENIPVLLALLGIWNSNFLGAESHAIVPYDEYLQYLPDHLQQLDMESNGKQVSKQGENCNYQTGPVIWGGAGTNGQHAYFQLMHQGTRLIPVDFIVPLQSQNNIGEHHAILYANCLAQSQAMMQGKTEAEAKAELISSGLSTEQADELAKHKVIPGNKPSNTLIVNQLTPSAVGAIIALYEHKVMVQGAIWQLNSFDQWGVELGKVLGKPILAALDGAAESDLSNFDESTQQLINMFRNR